MPETAALPFLDRLRIGSRQWPLFHTQAEILALDLFAFVGPWFADVN